MVCAYPDSVGVAQPEAQRGDACALACTCLVLRSPPTGSSHVPSHPVSIFREGRGGEGRGGEGRGGEGRGGEGRGGGGEGRGGGGEGRAASYLWISVVTQQHFASQLFQLEPAPLPVLHYLLELK